MTSIDTVSFPVIQRLVVKIGNMMRCTSCVSFLHIFDFHLALVAVKRHKQYAKTRDDEQSSGDINVGFANGNYGTFLNWWWIRDEGWRLILERTECVEFAFFSYLPFSWFHCCRWWFCICWWNQRWIELIEQNVGWILFLIFLAIYAKPWVQRFELKPGSLENAKCNEENSVGKNFQTCRFY